MITSIHEKTNLKEETLNEEVWQMSKKRVVR